MRLILCQRHYEFVFSHTVVLLWRMVSTRGVKFKFSEGERVLCYEPDPTKAKVLYDSKVLEVIVNKETRGKKSVEYLIHFQGWNSSWDRCVSEDYVLKDTDENRQLQRDLAEKAQLQLGAYLYRRERKKRHRKLSEKINDSLEQKKGRHKGGGGASSEDGSSGSQSQRDAEDSEEEEEEDEEEEEEEEELSSSGESSAEDEERVPLELSESLKRILELDYELITKKDKVLNLPADPNIVTILEGYVKHCAVNHLCGISDKPQRRFRYHHQNNKMRDLDRACRSLNICKEVVDGVRIYFDFTLGDLLLYNQEREQYEQLRMTKRIKQECIEVFDELSNIVKQEGEEEDDSQSCTPDGDVLASTNISSTNNAEDLGLDIGDAGRKRSLRSHRLMCTDTNDGPASGYLIGNAESNGVSKFNLRNYSRSNEGGYSVGSIKHENPNSLNMSSITSTSSRCSTPTTSLVPGVNSTGNTAHSTAIPNMSSSPRTNSLLSKILTWQLVPDHLYNKVPVPPSLFYGAVHLTRLFVKLPDLLYATNMPDRKLKVLLRHLDMFLNYLEEHSEWFGEEFYKNNPSST